MTVHGKVRTRASPFRLFGWFVAVCGTLTVISVLVGVGVVVFGLHHFSRGLPEYSQLADYQPPTLTRLHAGDGRLLAEYAQEQRVFVPIETIPELLDRYGGKCPHKYVLVQIPRNRRPPFLEGSMDQ